MTVALPLRLDIRLVSSVSAQLVLMRGLEVVDVLGEWKAGRWDLTKAGSAADRIARVLPKVEERAAQGSKTPWSTGSPAPIGLHVSMGCQRTAPTCMG